MGRRWAGTSTHRFRAIADVAHFEFNTDRRDLAEPHYIRLHGPWTAEIRDSQVVEARWATNLRVPFECPDARQWLQSMELDIASPTACLRLTRKFKWPHAIESDQTIAIEIESDWVVESIELNGNRILMEQSQSFRRSASISELLLPHNELTLPLKLGSIVPTGFRLSGVRLRISGNPQCDFDD